jgi:hypothetical protein
MRSQQKPAILQLDSWRVERLFLPTSGATNQRRHWLSSVTEERGVRCTGRQMSVTRYSRELLNDFPRPYCSTVRMDKWLLPFRLGCRRILGGTLNEKTRNLCTANYYFMSGVPCGWRRKSYKTERQRCKIWTSLSVASGS